MVLKLVRVELALRRRAILEPLSMIVLTVPVFAVLLGLQVAAGLLPYTLCFAAWEYSRKTAYDDDIAQSWAFLRSLPISPAQVVSVRYLATLGVFIAYALAALGVSLALPFVRAAVRPGAWPAVVAVPTGVGLLLIALFNALYFRFGYKVVTVAFPYLLALWTGLLLVVISPLGRSRAVVEDRQGFDGIIHPRSQGRPARTVPLGDVGGQRVSRKRE